MGLGVLESSQEVVPGTIQLFDSVENTENTAHLKHAADGKTILAPQPSDSPNDPLNWPTIQKDLIYFVLLICSICSGVHGPLLSPVTLELTVEFDKSVNDIAQLSSYMLLVIAGVAYFDSAIAHVYGKRGIFVISLAILVASDAWASKAGGYGSLMGARVLSGAGQAAFECLSLSVIPDLYFVHQRGKRIGAFIVLFSSGVYLGVPIATAIIDVSSWRMAFAGLAITEGVMLVLLFMFFWEPVYKRFHVDPLAHLSETVVLEKMNDPTVEHKDVSDTGATDIEAMERVNTAAAEQKRTYLQNLKLFNGRYSHNSFFLLLYRALILTIHPTVLWTGTAGLLLSWPVGVSYTIAAFMSLPPYNFSPQAMANMYIAGWLGTIIALVFGSLIFGWLAKVMTRKNQNIYEPEFLLLQCIPGLICSIIGIVGWGWGSQDLIPWGGLAIFLAIQLAGAIFVNNSVIAYIIDAHREYANESQVILFAIKVFHNTFLADIELLPVWYGIFLCSLVGFRWS